LYSQQNTGALVQFIFGMDACLIQTNIQTSLKRETYHPKAAHPITTKSHPFPGGKTFSVTFSLASWRLATHLWDAMEGSTFYTKNHGTYGGWKLDNQKDLSDVMCWVVPPSHVANEGLFTGILGRDTTQVM